MELILKFYHFLMKRLRSGRPSYRGLLCQLSGLLPEDSWLSCGPKKDDCWTSPTWGPSQSSSNRNSIRSIWNAIKNGAKSLQQWRSQGTGYYPPASKASREVANLTWRKIHTHRNMVSKNLPVCLSVCLSVMNFDLNYLSAGEIEWAQIF